MMMMVRLHKLECYYRRKMLNFLPQTGMHEHLCSLQNEQEPVIVQKHWKNQLLCNTFEAKWSCAPNSGFFFFYQATVSALGFV